MINQPMTPRDSRFYRPTTNAEDDRCCITDKR